MDRWEKMWIEVHTGSHYRYVTLRADGPLDPGGLSHLWFVFERNTEWYGFVSGKQSAFEDGYHKLFGFGELCTFLDFEPPNHMAGRTSVPYVRMMFPMHVRHMLDRLVKRRSYDLAEHDARASIDLPLSTRKRWMRQYGQATGRVEWRLQMQDKERLHRDFLDPSFFRCLENVRRIAANTTRAWWEVAAVSFTTDGPGGYYWAAYNPRGGMIMNGGIIDHSHGNSESSWSIHT